MATRETKDEVLAAFNTARREHEAFLAGIPRSLMTVPGATGPWTIKDVIAHVAAWRQRTIDRMAAASRGEAPPPPSWPADLHDDDSINAWIYEQTRELPLDVVLGDWSMSFDRIATLIGDLPDEALFDPQRFPNLEGHALAEPARRGFLDHFREEHEPTLRSWIVAQGHQP